MWRLHRRRNAFARWWRLLRHCLGDTLPFKRHPDLFFRRWLGPQRQPATEGVIQDLRSKEKFVVPLDLSHFQQAVDQVNATAVPRIARGGFVFSNIATLEL